METFCTLLALSVASQRILTRSFDVFFDLHLNKRLSEQSWNWWFETPSRSLWRHCNAGQGRLIGWHVLSESDTDFSWAVSLVVDIEPFEWFKFLTAVIIWMTPHNDTWAQALYFLSCCENWTWGICINIFCDDSVRWVLYTDVIFSDSWFRLAKILLANKLFVMLDSLSEGFGLRIDCGPFCCCFVEGRRPRHLLNTQVLYPTYKCVQLIMGFCHKNRQQFALKSTNN